MALFLTNLDVSFGRIRDISRAIYLANTYQAPCHASIDFCGYSLCIVSGLLRARNST